MNVLLVLVGSIAVGAIGYWMGRRHGRKEYRTLAARAASLNSFAADVQASTERVRAAIARELHDQLGGIFVASKMDLDLIGRRLATDDAAMKAKLAQVSASLDAGLALKRQLVERLRPSILDHLGLYAALQWRLTEMCTASGRECTARLPDGDPGIATDAAIIIYRIVEEAITRALGSDETSLVELDASSTAEELRLALTDDGGSSGDSIAPSLDEAWLRTLTHRAEALGGTCLTERRPDGGTRIKISFPLSRLSAGDGG